MPQPSRSITISLLLGCVLFAGFASAQVQRGSITGVVFDTSGAVVPGAQVTITDEGTGATFTAKSSGEGTFTIPGLPYGSYTVRIAAQGFRQWEATKVQVVTAQESSVKATLAVGVTNEVVTVEGVQATLDATSSELKMVIDNKQILDLPSTTRNPLDFATQMAGVTSTGSATSGGSIMNGLRGSSNNLVQDGIDVRDSFIKTSGFSAASNITLESLGEFSITGQNVGADSGDGVVQIRMTTRRGGNQFHGSAFYSHRNDAFNANSWTNNFTGTPITNLRQHRYGGSFGGPVEIPKVYNGKERTFFFFSYSVFQRNFAATASRTVLTAPARAGLFTYTGGDGLNHTVNLLTTSTRGLPINAFTKSLIDATPLPAASGGVSLNPAAGDSFNLAGIRFNAPGTELDKLYDLRVDHKLMESRKWGTHWIEAEWHWEHDATTPGADAQFPKGIASNCIGSVCDVSDPTDSHQRLGALAINSTFGATAFNEIRFGFSRPEITFLPPPFPRTFNLYFPGVVNQTANPASNAMSNPEYAFDPQGRLSPFYSLADNFTKVKGTHTIKAGLLISSASTHRFNDFAGGAGVNGGVIPVVALGSNATNPDGLSNCASFPSLPAGTTGSSVCTRAQNIYASLTGLVNNVSETYNAIPGQGFVPGLTDAFWIRERAYNFYVRDSWKFRPTVTIDAGVRWEIVPAPDMVNKRMLVPSNEVTDLTPYGGLFQTSSTVTYNSLLSNLAGTTQLVPGGSANGAPFWSTRYNNFAPSLGVAWQVNPKTVVRAGYSLSFIRDTLTIISNVTTSNLGLHTGIANSPASGDPLAVLNTSVNQVLPSPPFQVPQAQYRNFLGSFSSTAGSGLYAIDPNLKTPYVQQWTVGVQRELSRSMAIEVRYVGNHGLLYRGDDLSQPNVTPALLSEFNQANTNFLVCSANRAACTGSATGTLRFDNRGLAGQGKLPVLEAINFPATFYTSTTFTNTFFAGQLAPGQFWFLASNNCTQQFLNKTGCAGLGAMPANFFMSNPFAAFDRVFSTGMSSRYDGLQVEVRRRMSHGLQLQANYTWSNVLSNSGITGSQSELDATLDFHNPRFNRSRADFDIRHTYHFIGVYELPFGRGRRWASKGLVGRALEGWQTGALWTWRSGIPMSIVSALGTLNRTGNAASNPAVALGLNDAAACGAFGIYKGGAGAYYVPASDINFNTSATAAPGSTLGANTTVFANPTPGSLGDSGLRKACSGPGLNQFDINFVKKTHLTERITFEFRAEMFNIFNHANFNPPATGNINNTGFGTLTTNFTAREIQFNGRISF